MSKTARVTGEVVVKKDVEQRTETVKDSVRSTKVDVDDERTSASKIDSKAAQRRYRNANREPNDSIVRLSQRWAIRRLSHQTGTRR